MDAIAARSTFNTQYANLLEEVLAIGERREDRTGTGTISLFGKQLVIEDVVCDFPLLLLKKMDWRKPFIEMEWFLSGSTNIKPLVDKGVNVWNEWPHRYYTRQTDSDITVKEFTQRIKNDADFAAEWGELGPVYGFQWRNFNGGYNHRHFGNKVVYDGEDQISNVISTLRNNPTDRRMIVSAWNPSALEAMQISGLPPCHYAFQLYVSYLDPTTPALNMLVNIRSGDLFLGTPYNAAQYAYLLHVFARCVNMRPQKLVIQFGDAHIYSNHMEQAWEVIERREFVERSLQHGNMTLPKINIIDRGHQYPWSYNPLTDVEVTDYVPLSAINAPVAV